jgi:hypothetical protein
MACLDGDLPSVDAMLRERKQLDPAVNDHAAFKGTWFYGHLPVVNRLLEDKRVDPAAKGNLAIGMASEHGHLSVVHHLLKDKRVNPAAKDSTILFLSLFLSVCLLVYRVCVVVDGRHCHMICDV